MVSASGRFVIAFNGEIYNHRDLRQEMEKLGSAPLWRGHSDTETLLAGCEAFGIEATLVRSVGMFAIALWDREERTLILARDRMGEKPMYYGWQGVGESKVFLFGSELKALRAHPSFLGKVDRGALCLFMRHNYIPAPYSIYENIAKLLPGCMLEISSLKQEPKVWKYWDAVEAARVNRSRPFLGTAQEAVDALEKLASEAVRQQMVADVPLGAFLSGGIDSSAVVALMQAESGRPVKSFTIGFNEERFNEAGHAKAIAEHLNTDHTELYVTPEEAMKVIPRLPSLYCEPFADPAQIPNFIMSQLARQHVTVSLSGDAGDELFCGYSRYQATDNLWHKRSLLPAPLRASIVRGVSALCDAEWDSLVRFTEGLVGYPSLRHKLQRVAKVLNCKDVEELYRYQVSFIDNPSDWVVDGCEPVSLLTELRPNLEGLNATERMMALDCISYLPDDILVKVDRAGMGVSLECRMPFLDHRIVEFAWSLPLSYKFREGQTKWPLRQLLYRHVPRKLVERPKMGLGVPLRSWLRGPLRAWAESLLNEQRLNREGFFHSIPIRKMWAEHLSGRFNFEFHLWNILMFQLWYEEQG
jgi:asparagine synthase (glutamine-hydrolysing)